jgi:outer membrane lipoprotein-sorting protein
MKNALLSALAPAALTFAVLVASGSALAQDADVAAAPPEPPVAADVALQPVPEAEREALIEEIDSYLADLDVLRGSFFQIEPTGVVSQGEFVIDRPGLMWFEYADPHPFTLVSDGATYSVWDRELEDVNTRVPLRETPMNMFLKRDVDLGADADIVALTRSADQVALTLKDRDERVEGTLKLVFAAPAIELRSFTTTDNTGAETEVVLTDVSRGGPVDPSMFVVREPRRRDRR